MNGLLIENKDSCKVLIHLAAPRRFSGNWALTDSTLDTPEHAKANFITHISFLVQLVT